MLIDEVEVQGATLSFRCLTLPVEDIKATFDTLMERGDTFSIETRKPGFHDCDCDSGIIRGYYSNLHTFEVEHLVDDLPVKESFVRIESCEFIITPIRIYVMGKPGPAKLLEMALSGATGNHVEKIEFDLDCMHKVQSRVTVMKSIVVENPKDNPIRRARLSGHMEEYEALPIIESNNHEINSISGQIETPLGPMKLSVDKKGKISLGVKKGMIINVENMNWIFDLITADEAPAITALAQRGAENAPF